MKNTRRILAIAGVILLLAMYVMSFVFAISGSESADGWFKVSLFCTIAIPVMLYAYTLVYRYLKDRQEEIRKEKDRKEENSQHTDSQSDSPI